MVLLLQATNIPMKLFQAQNKITLISRQSDEVPVDFMLVCNYLNQSRADIKVQILTKKLDTRSLRTILYPFHMLRQMYHISTSKVVLLDGYCIVASVLKHKAETKVIQMWHATSAIKKFGWQTIGWPGGSSLDTATIMNMHGNYDYVLAPSKKTGKIYQEAFRVTEDKIIYFGLPHLSQLRQTNPAALNEIRERYAIDPTKKVILYVPTFRDGKCIDLEGLTNAIDFERYELVVKIHPIDTLPPHDDSVVYAREYTTQLWMQLADAIITDYSSLMVEAAILHKPLFLYVYDLEEYRSDTGLNVDFRQEQIAPVVFEDAAALVGNLDSPYDYAMLARFLEEYIEIDVSNSTRDFCEFIIHLMNGVTVDEEKN